MRLRLALLVLAALTPAAAADQLWTSACQDQQTQYQQIVGGDGYFHVSQEGGVYTTVKLKQSYHDKHMICGTVPAKVRDGDIATVCADDEAQAIRIIKGGELAKGMKPKKAPVYCPAVVNAQ